MTADKVSGRAARSQEPEAVKMRQDLENWHQALSDRSITEIKRYRDMRRLSNDQLRERLAMLGWQLTKDSLGSILGGKRKVMPVGDLLLFAQALNVPPVALALPIWTNETTPLFPYDAVDDESRAATQAQWFGGDADSTAVPNGAWLFYDDGGESYELVLNALEAAQRTQWSLSQLRALNYNLYDPELGPKDKEMTEEFILRIVKVLADQRRTTRQLYPDMKLPSLPPCLEFVDARNYVVPPLPLPGLTTESELEVMREQKQRAAAVDSATPSNEPDTNEPPS